MSFSRPFQLYHSETDPIWPDDFHVCMNRPTWTAQTLAGLGNLAPGFEATSQAHRQAKTKI